MMRIEVDAFIQKFLRALAIAVIILVVDGVGILNPLKNIIERQIISVSQIQTPILKLIKTPADMISYYKTGSNRILDLENRLAAALVDRARLNDLEQENLSLRQLLESPLPPDWDYITAPVIGRSVQQMVVGVGQNQGVTVGSSVIYEDVFIGTVSQVSQTLATVDTVFNPQQKTAVTISSTSFDGLVINDDTKLHLTQVLQNATLEPGMVVITSGIDGKKPRLVVGTIKEILEDDQGLYKQARLEQPISIESLTTVFIVKEN